MQPANWRSFMQPSWLHLELSESTFETVGFMQPGWLHLELSESTWRRFLRHSTGPVGKSFFELWWLPGSNTLASDINAPYCQGTYFTSPVPCVTNCEKSASLWFCLMMGKQKPWQSFSNWFIQKLNVSCFFELTFNSRCIVGCLLWLMTLQ